MKYILYKHHNREVFVRSDLKSKHREYCLCYSCLKLDIGNRESNCKIADMLYGINKLTGILTPVWECPNFIKKENQKKIIPGGEQ